MKICVFFSQKAQNSNPCKKQKKRAKESFRGVCVTGVNYFSLPKAESAVKSATRKRRLRQSLSRGALPQSYSSVILRWFLLTDRASPLRLLSPAPFVIRKERAPAKKQVPIKVLVIFSVKMPNNVIFS